MSIFELLCLVPLTAIVAAGIVSMVIDAIVKMLKGP